jgi:SAM-dependent methyltransferase
VSAVALVAVDGTCVDDPAATWAGTATPGELELLAHLDGPVLDVGCGPGRHAEALHRLGTPVVGIDVGAGAVDLARRRGVEVWQRSVFEPLPWTGAWGAAVLLDGNLGLGGDVVALLRRVRELLRTGGTALVETAPPLTPSASRVVRLEVDGSAQPDFAQAVVPLECLAELAWPARLPVRRVVVREDRWFAFLAAV